MAGSGGVRSFVVCQCDGVCLFQCMIAMSVILAAISVCGSVCWMPV